MVSFWCTFNIANAPRRRVAHHVSHSIAMGATEFKPAFSHA